MKTKSLVVLLFAAIVIVSGCKKDGAGKKAIGGFVYFQDGISPPDNIAPGATVYISFGTKVFTGNVDETTTSDSKGAYIFKGLKKDDYFVWGEYTTSHGFTYSTPGHGITVEGGKDRFDLNLRLY